MQQVSALDNQDVQYFPEQQKEDKDINIEPQSAITIARTPPFEREEINKEDDERWQQSQSGIGQYYQQYENRKLKMDRQVPRTEVKINEAQDNQNEQFDIQIKSNSVQVPQEKLQLQGSIQQNQIDYLPNIQVPKGDERQQIKEQLYKVLNLQDNSQIKVPQLEHYLNNTDNQESIEMYFDEINSYLSSMNKDDKPQSIYFSKVAEYIQQLQQQASLKGLISKSPSLTDLQQDRKNQQDKLNDQQQQNQAIQNITQNIDSDIKSNQDWRYYYKNPHRQEKEIQSTQKDTFWQTTTQAQDNLNNFYQFGKDNISSILNESGKMISGMQSGAQWQQDLYNKFNNRKDFISQFLSKRSEQKEKASSDSQNQKQASQSSGNRSPLVNKVINKEKKQKKQGSIIQSLLASKDTNSPETIGKKNKDQVKYNLKPQILDARKIKYIARRKNKDQEQAIEQTETQQNDQKFENMANFMHTLSTSRSNLRALYSINKDQFQSIKSFNDIQQGDYVFNNLSSSVYKQQQKSDYNKIGDQVDNFLINLANASRQNLPYQYDLDKAKIEQLHQNNLANQFQARGQTKKNPFLPENYKNHYFNTQVIDFQEGTQNPQDTYKFSTIMSELGNRFGQALNITGKSFQEKLQNQQDLAQNQLDQILHSNLVNYYYQNLDNDEIKYLLGLSNKQVQNVQSSPFYNKVYQSIETQASNNVQKLKEILNSQLNQPSTELIPIEQNFIQQFQYNQNKYTNQQFQDISNMQVISDHLNKGQLHRTRFHNQASQIKSQLYRILDVDSLAQKSLIQDEQMLQQQQSSNQNLKSNALTKQRQRDSMPVEQELFNEVSTSQKHQIQRQLKQEQTEQRRYQGVDTKAFLKIYNESQINKDIENLVKLNQSKGLWKQQESVSNLEKEQQQGEEGQKDEDLFSSKDGQGIFSYNMSGFVNKLKKRIEENNKTVSQTGGNNFDDNNDDTIDQQNVDELMQRMLRQGGESQHEEIQALNNFDQAMQQDQVKQPRQTRMSGQANLDNIVQQQQNIQQYQQQQQAKLGSQQEEEDTFIPIENQLLKISQKAMSVRNFAQMANVYPRKVVQILRNLGENNISESSAMDINLMEIVGLELGYKVERELVKEPSLQFSRRSPVVTIMGHVDHGKTSLLDALRNANVTASEEGGITQHIGAFSVSLEQFLGQDSSNQFNDTVTFLDTPGHSAFSSMRMRGVSVTDIGVIVVSIDDMVMPQTQESIRIARDANIAIIIAVTKCDKRELLRKNLPKLTQQLREEGLDLEEDGGTVQVIQTSATSGQGLDDLVQGIALVGELLDLQAPVNVDAQARVIESKFNPQLGHLASIIVTQGELKVGDHIVIGDVSTRIKGLRMAQQGIVRKALAGQPVEIQGLKGMVDVGEKLEVQPSAEKAQNLARARSKQKAMEMEKAPESVPQDKSSQEIQIRQSQKDPIVRIVDNSVYIPQKTIIEYILISDVKGSMEAIISAMKEMANPYVEIQIVRQGYANLKLEDIMIAQSSKMKILCFNLPPVSEQIMLQAQNADVDICQFKVIYDLLNEVSKDLVDYAPRLIREDKIGEAFIANTFNLSATSKSKFGETVAGCRVVSGNLLKGPGTVMKVQRKGQVIHQGQPKNIRHFKEVVNQIQSGQECGITFAGFENYQIGDTIECYQRIEEKLVPQAMDQGGVKLVKESDIDK